MLLCKLAKQMRSVGGILEAIRDGRSSSVGDLRE